MGGLEETEVLVTGSTGFIGSHLTKRLANENVIVNMISRKEHSSVPFSLQKIKAWKADLLDLNTLMKCIRRINPRKVFHLGAFVDSDSSLGVSSQCIQTNIQGTVNLLYALRKVDLDCFIYIGTCEVYGKGRSPFTERQAIRPLSPYSISKAAGEFFCTFAQEAFNIPAVTLRLSHVYGPNQALTKLIPYVILCCLKGKNPVLTQGDQVRDFIYVSDIVEGIIRSSCKREAIGEIINLGKGEPNSIRSVVMKIVDMMNSPVTPLFGALPPRTYEPKRCYCSISKARKILNWEPQIGLEEGLEKTISWYSRNFRGGNRDE